MGDDQVLPGLTEVIRENQEADPTEWRHPEKLRPRFEPINREQMVMQVVDVEQLVDQEHPVRAIWEFVGRLNLSSFCEQIRAVEGERGRPTYDPRLMISLWIYGYSRGVSSAREIARLCEYDRAFQWLTGMKVVNYHSLSDFRVEHGEAVKKLFAEVMGVLMLEGLIELERVMHDGTKIKTSASPTTFQGEKSVQRHLEIARKHLEEIEAQSDVEATRRVAKARERGARQKQQRLELALEEFKKIRAGGTKEGKKREEIRVSQVEPEARKMKHSDGGFAPSYNVQVSTDHSHGVIVGVGISQAPTDYDELLTGVDRVQENAGRLPVQVVTDGGYTNGNNIHGMQERGVDFIAPVTDSLIQLKHRGIDEAFSRQAFVYDEVTNSYTCPSGKALRYKGKELRRKSLRYRYRANAVDCQDCPFKQQCCPRSTKGRSLMRLEHESEVASHRAKMETDEAKQIYKQRGQTAEFPNAWIKEKLGLRRFRLLGLIKAGLEITWACVTYNIQQWIRLRWRLNRYTSAKT